MRREATVAASCVYLYSACVCPVTSVHGQAGPEEGRDDRSTGWRKIVASAG